jgi:dTDP-4-amino-4,6-dideoxygalactose transaminase
MIPITKPFLPPKQEYQKYLDGIWNRAWLTNNGPLVNELELRLKEYLDVPHILFLCNGTMALQIAIKALDLKGDIITTPCSYIATASSIVWEGCRPVFVDIDSRNFNIDPAKIEAAITADTKAILATHVYGNPCDITAIDAIAKKHQLKVIYDGAHCFGTRYKGKSIFTYGDITTTSFHATKLYHTVEGGAVFTNDGELLKKMAFMRNFGYNGPEDFAEIGINAKNSEFHAAMGLCNLNYADRILELRKDQSERYNRWLRNDRLRSVEITKNAKFNYAYYPIVFQTEAAMIKVIEQLEAHLIFPRRYFFPSLNTMHLYKGGALQVSEDLSRRVLCLPLYHELSFEEIDFISRIILRSINN